MKEIIKMEKKILALGIVVLLTFGAWLAAQGPPDRGPILGTAVLSDLSMPLRDIGPAAPISASPRQIPNIVKFLPPGPGGPDIGIDPLIQASQAPVSPLAPTPAPTLSFDGTSDDDNAAVAGGRIVPPDTNGDVGPNHYVQMNNLVFEIFDKNGASVLGPLANSTLWSTFGGICQTNNDGDPIVFHDQLADRWVFSQFAIGSTGHQCFAVSQTPDPTGAYFRFDFAISPGLNGFNDYPKIGMWPDGYYLTANEFGGPSQSFQFPIAVAFDRDKMLLGDPTAGFVRFNVPGTGGATFFALQPSHWEGSAPPPAGAPNVFAMALDTATWGGAGSDGYELWEFDVDWTTPASSTFTSLGRVATANFDANLCNFAECAPQPSPGELLDTLSQFTMFRLMYRNLNGTEILLLNHTVDLGANRAGIRWAELRKNGTWGIQQTGTYAPADDLHRWMGSIAMDGDGNIALSYTSSGTSAAPSVQYNSRTAADPAGTLPGGEVACVFGGGVQTGSANRWGDYSAISVDPVDDCTFWLTNEYYANTGSFDFKTRVCSFKLDGCGASNAVDLHVDALVTATQPEAGGHKRALATVTIKDDLGAPVVGATVNGMFSGDIAETASGVTGSDGTVEIASVGTIRTRDLSFSFCVSDVVHTLPYDPSDNPDPSFACSTTGATEMHVEDLRVGLVNAGGGKKGRARVLILDNAGNPASGVQVTVNFGGDFSETVSGTTSGTGRVTLQTTATLPGTVSVEACVDDVVDPSGALTYNPADNPNPSFACGSTSASGMHVEAMQTGSFNSGGGLRKGRVRVTILDEFGAPAVGVEVTVTFGGSFSETVTGVTSATGQVTIQTVASLPGPVTVTACVEDVVDPSGSLTYQPGDNTDPGFACAP